MSGDNKHRELLIPIFFFDFFWRQVVREKERGKLAPRRGDKRCVGARKKQAEKRYRKCEGGYGNAGVFETRFEPRFNLRRKRCRTAHILTVYQALVSKARSFPPRSRPKPPVPARRSFKRRWG